MHLPRSAPAAAALAAVLLAAAPAAAQEQCAANSEWGIPGVVREQILATSGAQDWGIAKAQVTTILDDTRRFMDLILKLDEIGHPRGMQIGWNRAVGTPEPGRMTLPGQPFPYRVEAMVFGFACPSGVVKRRWTDADAGVSVDVNSLYEILNNAGEIGGRQVYALDLDLGPFRGHRLFSPGTSDPRDPGHFRRSVLVTRPGRLPYRHVTRGEFFDHLAGELSREEGIETARAAASVKVRPQAEQDEAIKRRIKEIEGYAISESAKQARIRRVLADAKSDEQAKADATSGSTAAFARMRRRLASLRGAMTPAQLAEPAVIRAGTSIHYGLLAAEDWKFESPAVDLACRAPCVFGQYLVTIDETSFDRSLPRTAPQFFVVSVTALGLPADQAPGWRRLREDGLARLDLDALAAMLPH